MFLILECCHVLSSRRTSPYTAVMLKLHLDEGVVTKEECKEIDNLKEDFTTIQASLLSLVLCTKSQKQYKVAIKTLEGYPTVSDLTKLTLRYLSGKHRDSFYSGYATNSIYIVANCPESYGPRTYTDFSSDNMSHTD